MQPASFFIFWSKPSKYWLNSTSWKPSIFLRVSWSQNITPLKLKPWKQTSQYWYTFSFMYFLARGVRAHLAPWNYQVSSKKALRCGQSPNLWRQCLEQHSLSLGAVFSFEGNLGGQWHGNGKEQSTSTKKNTVITKDQKLNTVITYRGLQAHRRCPFAAWSCNGHNQPNIIIRWKVRHGGPKLARCAPSDSCSNLRVCCSN